MSENNHTTKASVFEDLFSYEKYRFELYKVLHPDDNTLTADDVKEITLSNMFLKGRFNDLGILAGNKLIILVEAQSTWSVNIIPRCIMYLANTWESYGVTNEFNWYGSKKVALPEAELYVVYTGDKQIDKTEITLKDEFFDGKPGAIDATVKIITKQDENNILGQYITFCKVYDEQRKMYPTDAEKAAAETIRICSEKDVLAEYLKDKGKEATSMMTLLFDQEYARKMELLAERKDAEAIGVLKGRAEGMAAGIATGMQKILQLMQYLDAAGRKEDAQKIIYDNALCSQLMAEYGLA